ncbi:MAG TPA: radical SAM family heme chaperone HemW [Clostridia bacterium]|nr:radical SAM family heme chaperone HemW [Clostridia bacterium]
MPGIYLHIPFCMAKCRYCDFVSFADHAEMDAYLDALEKEMTLDREALPALVYDTVFLGGGTPSVLPEGAISRILETLTRRLRVTPDAEITIEANPGTLAPDKLTEYKRAGVNRLSLGLQSADDHILKGLGRIHTYAQFLESFHLARETGFGNVNADIMYGLPGQTAEDHLDTIEKLAALDIEHVSAYSLILEENTPLYTDVTGGAESLPGEDAAYEMHRSGIRLLSERGYRRYEISNYAKPGYESRHNLNYWNNGEYLGLGLNAHSAMRVTGKWLRWANTAKLSDYIQACARGERPLEAKEQEIPMAEEMFETVMLGLRKIEGVSDAAFQARFGRRMGKVFQEAIARLEKRGWLVAEDGFYRLTDEGLDFQNQALLEMM